MKLDEYLKSLYTSGDNYTVLQLLKVLIDGVKQGTVANIEVVRTDAAHVKLVFIANDGSTEETSPIAIGAADLDTVYSMLSAGSNITLTKNTTTNKVVIAFTSGSNINVGTLTSSGNANIGNNATINGTLNVNNGATIEGGLGIVDSGLSVDENALIGGTAEITGDVSMHGNLIVDGYIEQETANYSADIARFPTASLLPSTPTFCRIQQINQELHIIFVGKVTNNTANEVTSYQLSGVFVDLPSTIAEKIYDVNGKKVSESISYETRIALCPASFFRDSETYLSMGDFQANVVFGVCNAPAPNRIFVTFASPTAMTFQAGKDTYLEGRVFLDLL